MLTRAAARRTLEAAHASHGAEQENESMEIDEPDSPSNRVEENIQHYGIQRRRQVRMEEELLGNHRLRQVVVAEELVSLEEGGYHESMNQQAIIETQNLVIEQEKRVEQRMQLLADHNNQQVLHATEASEKRIQQLLQAQQHQSQQYIATESLTLKQALQVALEKGVLESQERYRYLLSAWESQIKALEDRIQLQGASAAHDQSAATTSIMTELETRLEQTEAHTQASIASHSNCVGARLKETLNEARHYTKQQISSSEKRLQETLDAATATMRSEATQRVAGIARQIQLQLQTTQKRIETNASGIEARIQSKLDQQHSDDKQQNDSKLHQLERRWHDNIETTVESNVERHCTLIEERLQQKLVDANAQQRLDMESKTEEMVAAMNAKVEAIVAETSILCARHVRFENSMQDALAQTKAEVREYIDLRIRTLGTPSSDPHSDLGNTTSFLHPDPAATDSRELANVLQKTDANTIRPEVILTTSPTVVAQLQNNQVVLDQPQHQQQSATQVQTTSLSPSNYQQNPVKDQTAENTAASRLNLVEARLSARRDVELRARTRVAALRRKARLKMKTQ